MEFGEVSGISLAEKPPLGALEVKVVSKGRERGIDRAEVVVTVERHGNTGGDGTLTLPKLRPDTYDVRATRKYPENDYFTFITHYPAIKIPHKAIGRGSESVSVRAGTTASQVIKLDYYRHLPRVVLHRDHIRLNPGPNGDKYGHWWIVIDNESYGWWPKYSVVSEENGGLRLQPPAPLPRGASTRDKVQHKFAMMIHKARLGLFGFRKTLSGVEGELNGITSFEGTQTQDPHARRGELGRERYQVIVTDEEDDATIKQNLRNFARGYSGSWSWRFEFGRNCHTFQVAMLRAAELKRFRQY